MTMPPVHLQLSTLVNPSKMIKYGLRIRNHIFYGIKNISKCNLPFPGLIYAITALGVAAGYMGGGLFLNLWVDVDKSEVDVDK